MLIEELIDGVQYQQKEIDNLSYQLYEIEHCQSYKVNINDLIKDINLDDYKINFHDDYKINTLVIKMLIKTMDKQQNTINRSEEHTSELQSRGHLVCRLLIEKKKKSKK